MFVETTQLTSLVRDLVFGGRVEMVKLSWKLSFGRRCWTQGLWFVLLAAVSTGAYAHSVSTGKLADLLSEPEVAILDISDHLYNGEFDQAESELQSLITELPDFKLAHLLYSELMKARSGLGPAFKDWASPKNSELYSLIDEIRRRHAHSEEVAIHGINKIPDLLLKVSDSQRQVIVVDSELSRAHLYRNTGEGLALVGDYYVTVGKNGLLKRLEGDGRTPQGVYFITSQLDGIGLEDLYGEGALPLNYPNEWDQRLGRTGYGIWLHGVPSDTYNRAPFSTEGCVAFPNEDIASLFNTPDIENTPVIISDHTQWVEQSTLRRPFAELSAQIDAWHRSKISGNPEKLSRFYANAFSSGRLGKNDWLTRVRDERSHAEENEFSLSDLSAFRYPGTPNLVVVSFNKEYLGTNASNQDRIRQYWYEVTPDSWRIVYEGPARYQPVHFKGIPNAILPVIAKELKADSRRDKRGS